MARFRDPNAPAGRVVFGGEAFIDGVTADITPGPETLLLFKSAGIVEGPVDDTPETEPEQGEAETPKPATSRKK